MCCYCEMNDNGRTKPLISISEVVDADIFIKYDMLWLLCRDIETGRYERKYIHIKRCPVCERELNEKKELKNAED